jgi:hypothetical protein
LKAVLLKFPSFPVSQMARPKVAKNTRVGGEFRASIPFVTNYPTVFSHLGEKLKSITATSLNVHALLK